MSTGSTTSTPGDEKIHIDAFGENLNINRRSGKLPDLRTREGFDISGAINAVNQFLIGKFLVAHGEQDGTNDLTKLKETKESHLLNGLVVVNYNEVEASGTITLKVEQGTPWESKVVANLSKHPVLFILGINDHTKTWTRLDLARQVRRLRHYFADKTQANKLHHELMNLEAEIKTTLEGKDDRKGNKKLLVMQDITSNIQSKLVLRIPLFAGSAEYTTFEVDLMVEAESGGDPIFVLESPELMMAQKEESAILLEAGLEEARKLEFPIVTNY